MRVVIFVAVLANIGAGEARAQDEATNELVGVVTPMPGDRPASERLALGLTDSERSRWSLISIKSHPARPWVILIRIPKKESA